MRDLLCMKNDSRSAAAGKSQQRGGHCGKRREILLIKTRFRERLNRRSGPLMGCSATSLVRTAPRLTRLGARRIRHDARSSRESNGRRKKRPDDCNTNRNPAKHHLINNTPFVPRLAGKLTSQKAKFWRALFCNPAGLLNVVSRDLPCAIFLENWRNGLDNLFPT